MKIRNAPARGGSASGGKSEIRKILFITLSNIGDAILTLPVLSALKDSFPDARIDVVVGPKPRQIFTKDPGINNIFIYDKHAKLKEKIDFIGRLKREKYDMAVDMRTSLIPILIGAKHRTSLISIGKNTIKHKRLTHLDKLKTLDIKYKKQRNIYIDNKDREAINKLFEKNGLRKEDVLIGVNPACRSLLKQWRTEGFIEVIDNLLKQGKHKIILIGDIGQVNIAREVKNNLKHEGLVDLVGKTNLNELSALIERLELLLTCDSACMHIACDLGVKVVAVFGPTDAEEYGPTGEDDALIRKDLKCSPCKKARCEFNHECMEQVSSEEVLEAIKKILT
ncbi:glycosyltransferase family 9 protein [Candidatus Omnitrophota bacterium]